MRKSSQARSQLALILSAFLLPSVLQGNFSSYIIGLTRRLGLSEHQIGKSGDQFIITLKKGDEIKLRLDHTDSTWNASEDGAIRLYANEYGIHTIVAHRDTNRIFKTTFSSGNHFVVTSNPLRLGVLSFESTNKPDIVYAPRPGTRYMQPRSQIPFKGKSLTEEEKRWLLNQSWNLAQKFGVPRDQFWVDVVGNQARISLKEGAVIRVKTGGEYVASEDNDIQLFADLLTVESGFHTLQKKRSSDYEIWAYDKSVPHLILTTLSSPQPVYLPVDFAIDLFEPAESTPES